MRLTPCRLCFCLASVMGYHCTKDASIDQSHYCLVPPSQSSLSCTTYSENRTAKSERTTLAEMTSSNHCRDIVLYKSPQRKFHAQEAELAWAELQPAVHDRKVLLLDQEIRVLRDRQMKSAIGCRQYIATSERIKYLQMRQNVFLLSDRQLFVNAQTGERNIAVDHMYYIALRRPINCYEPAFPNDEEDDEDMPELLTGC
ncbi:hypothetical protein B0H11DRAFT_1928528 [Mycena galericulata]|nr:hypothetical protein B0H11DRAFT_1928528 [Mycena galericulata]